jgi:hypothetical protein
VAHQLGRSARIGVVVVFSYFRKVSFKIF